MGKGGSNEDVHALWMAAKRKRSHKAMSEMSSSSQAGRLVPNPERRGPPVDLSEWKWEIVAVTLRSTWESVPRDIIWRHSWYYSSCSGWGYSSFCKYLLRVGDHALLLHLGCSVFSIDPVLTSVGVKLTLRFHSFSIHTCLVRSIKLLRNENPQNH